MKYQAYTAYKDSGVEWLGKIPEEWEVFSLRNAFTMIRNGCSFDQMTSEAENLVRVTRIETISNGTINYEKTGEVEYTNEIQRYRLIKGDISFSNINSLSMIGNVAMKEDDAELFAGMNLLQMRPSVKQHPKYLLWMFRGSLFRSTVEANAKPAINQASIPVSKLAGLPIPKIPLPTQQAIAAFLDTETARIDGLIKDYQELVSLLQEKRQALISHAVTRGLSELVNANDPEFGEWAKPVNFKDSGVEWLGEIPEGWEVKKLKHVSSSWCDGPFGSRLKSEHYSDSGTRVIRLQNIGNGRFEGEDVAFIPESYASTLGDHSVIPSDLLIAGLGDDNHPVGRCVVAPNDIGSTIVKADCFRFRLIGLCHSTFFAYHLTTTAIVFSKMATTGTTRERVNLTVMSNRPIAHPNIAEQKAIAAFLDKETTKMDTLVTEAESAIELLNEHRSALITNAVTGKINVEGLA